MNDTGYTPNNTLRLGLVEELLQGLEGEKSIDEVLISAEKFFIEDVSDRLIIQARQKITALKQRYTQEEMKDDEAKVEISGILLMLT